MMPYTFGPPFLFKNTKSTAILLSLSLHLNKFMTEKYQDWWCKVTISDLRANVGLLQKSAGYDPSKSKRTPGVTFRMMNPILRTKILMLNGAMSPLIFKLLIEDSEAVTRIQRLTLNVEGAKNAGQLLQILMDCFLGIAFSIISKVAQTC